LHRNTKGYKVRKGLGILTIAKQKQNHQKEITKRVQGKGNVMFENQLWGVKKG